MSVIAKRSSTEEIASEARIYRDVLPHLPIATVRFLGRLDMPNNRSWLFLEDAGGSRYRPDSQSRRALAASSLARLHVAGARLAATSGLRDRGAASFHGFIEPTIDLLNRALATNPALAADHRDVLAAVRDQCGTLAARWAVIEQVCSDYPSTFVHGDFKEDNMRVRTGPEGDDLVLFDWEQAGFALPALDLAKFLGYSVRPDLEVYCNLVSDVWPSMTEDAILRAGYIGEVFRWLASVRWEAEKLFDAWVEKPMSRFTVYHAWMREVLGARPWMDPWSADLIQAELVVPRTWH